MNFKRTVQITSAAAFLLLTAAAAHAHHRDGHDGGGSGGDVGPGPNDPVFTVESSEPYIPLVESHSVDTHGQIVFYGQMDLSGFEGAWDSGGACSHDGLRDGVIVIYPQSKQNPLAAELIFWFPAELESGDSVTHLLTMQGQFDEPDNWPPTANDPVTTVTLNYWEFAAENKKAQRQDCAGESDFPAGPWTVTVALAQ